MTSITETQDLVLLVGNDTDEELLASVEDGGISQRRASNLSRDRPKVSLPLLASQRRAPSYRNGH